MTHILILKTAALGDVLRTTSILPGLHERYTDAWISWVTARDAVDLLRTHPLIRSVVAVDTESDSSVADALTPLSATCWERVISLDDEAHIARIATTVPSKRLSGAYVRDDGTLAYTPDTAPWFDMGLLSVHGKTVADLMKIQNRKSHPQICADMLGLRMGKPELHLPADSKSFADTLAKRHGLAARRPLVGLNTGAGGRWTSKQLDVERTVAVAARVHAARSGKVSFLVLGGPLEGERNREIMAGLERAGVAGFDGGTDNALLDFAALVGACDVLLASDSLALHLAVAQSVRVVAFFAPTSAAEIELYGRGEKVVSTSPDVCSYRRDADNSTLTPERIAAALLREIAAAERERGA
ncbi:MAG TPA: glycosyltransferase family 9 protein [Planctomycetota bacterium]|nr:glycosyltransferase family 9 protein [Planctomycetota bacterium]